MYPEHPFCTLSHCGLTNHAVIKWLCYLFRGLLPLPPTIMMPVCSPNSSLMCIKRYVLTIWMLTLLYRYFLSVQQPQEPYALLLCSPHLHVSPQTGQHHVLAPTTTTAMPLPLTVMMMPRNEHCSLKYNPHPHFNQLNISYNDIDANRPCV